MEKRVCTISLVNWQYSHIQSVADPLKHDMPNKVYNNKTTNHSTEKGHRWMAEMFRNNSKSM